MPHKNHVREKPLPDLASKLFEIDCIGNFKSTADLVFSCFGKQLNKRRLRRPLNIIRSVFVKIKIVCISALKKRLECSYKST